MQLPIRYVRDGQLSKSPCKEAVNKQMHEWVLRKAIYCTWQITFRLDRPKNASQFCSTKPCFWQTQFVPLKYIHNFYTSHSLRWKLKKNGVSQKMAFWGTIVQSRHARSGMPKIWLFLSIQAPRLNKNRYQIIQSRHPASSLQQRQPSVHVKF